MTASVGFTFVLAGTMAILVVALGYIHNFSLRLLIEIISEVRVMDGRERSIWPARKAERKKNM